MLSEIDRKFDGDRYQAILRGSRDAELDCFSMWWSADVWVAASSEYVWARFNANNTALMQQAKALPVERFILEGHWLRREDLRVPEAKLPELDWQPISQAIELQLPWIGQPGQAVHLPSLTWELARGGSECPVAGAVIAWNHLAYWVELAPQWRLSRLRYCMAVLNGQRMALVLGTPVPPVEAQYLVAHQNILIPAGMHWLPAIETDCVQRSFDVRADQWLLWRETDDCCKIDDRLFSPLTRASLRAFGSVEL